MSAEDTKVIYTAIGKTAGLNVLFDPDYQSRRIPVDLDNVNVEDALRIVGTIAGTFYKVITPDTIFVAASTRQKHTDLDDVAVQTFYLTNAAQQADANEIVTALRNVLDARQTRSTSSPRRTPSSCARRPSTSSSPKNCSTISTAPAPR